MNTRYFHSVSSSNINGRTNKIEKRLNADGTVDVTEYRQGKEVKKYEEPFKEQFLRRHNPLRLMDNFGLVFQEPKEEAVAVVRRCDNDKRIGTILLEEQNNSLTITIHLRFSKLKDGKHGFHLHRSGDERNPDKKCTSLCSHYSRHKSDVHGGLTSNQRHNGDLGNIISKKGVIKEKITMYTDQLSLKECIGRAFVIHKDEDDLGMGNNEESLKTGNAGKRLAYALVGRL